MPYRARGKVVYVKRGARWVQLKVHPTAAKAKALNINVSHPEKARRKSK